ncbi:MAG: hypothetical protein HYY20_14480 [Candidatus Tectomicrobia bacterium]|uniref:DUF4198 domain-containing protein n=1 Tax=Tectimicrobiota bacterium TaxID=2528274 RepID=A0A932G2B0_UNCTE|nr:hypothetical protein [Candidatus Tectomicrobia bacterium]
MALFLGFFGFASAPDASAHTIHYRVAEKGVSVRLFYAANDPASYSPYEIFGPTDREPHQTGRTDKHGFLSFLPDRAGRWKVKIWGESTHGFHGATIDIQVDQALNLESFSQPMVATHLKLIIGISLIFGAFGLYALLLARRRPAP